jgi:NTP pyrophosphatase (non-canonical NTP hydrolase)
VRPDVSYLHGYDHPLDDAGVIRAVLDEYTRAKAKHGEHTLDGQQSSDLLRLAALVEEVGEVSELFTYDKDQHAHDEADWRAQLKKELIQVANVACTWASIL